MSKISAPGWKKSRFLDGKGAKQFKTDTKFHKIGIETLSDSNLRISFMNFAALLIIAWNYSEKLNM